MAKVTLPLISVDASGSLGKSIVFGNWRGVRYARQHVTPAQPRTNAQVAQRNLLRWVVRAWQYLPAVGQNGWIEAARNTSLTGYNLFSKRNLQLLNGETAISNVVVSPGQSGATNVESLSASYAAGEISWSATLGSTIPGTQVVAVHVIAFVQQNPYGDFVPPVRVSSDSTSPYAGAVTVDAAEQAWVLAAFTECIDAAGNRKFGVSVNTAVTA